MDNVTFVSCWGLNFDSLTDYAEDWPSPARDRELHGAASRLEPPPFGVPPLGGMKIEGGMKLLPAKAGTTNFNSPSCNFLASEGHPREGKDLRHFSAGQLMWHLPNHVRF